MLVELLGDSVGVRFDLRELGIDVPLRRVCHHVCIDKFFEQQADVAIEPININARLAIPGVADELVVVRVCIPRSLLQEFEKSDVVTQGVVGGRASEDPSLGGLTLIAFIASRVVTACGRPNAC